MKLMRILLLFLLLCITSAVHAQKNYAESLAEYREGYRNKFLEEGPRQPLKPEEVKLLRFFEADSTFKVEANFQRTRDEKPFEIPTSSGKTKTFVKFGIASFVLKGDTLELSIYRNLMTARLPMYRDHLFLPFQDDTNGDSTYGGGRYIDMEISDIQYGKLMIDFNKAYNPYCAYSDGWNCPIPPPENVLPLAIEAGEKDFEKGGKE